MAVVLVRTYQRKVSLPDQLVAIPIARFGVYQAQADELNKRLNKIEGGPRGAEEMDEVLKWYKATSKKWERWDG